MKLKEFIKKNYMRLVQINPVFNTTKILAHEINDIDEIYFVAENSRHNGHFIYATIFQAINNTLNMTCGEFSRIKSQIDVPNQFMKELYEILPSDVTHIIDKRKILREFLRKILLLASLCWKIIASHKESEENLKNVYYEFVDNFGPVVDIWLEVANKAKEGKNFHGAKEIIKRAIEYIPDSEKLWLKIAELEYEITGRTDENVIQNTIDHAIICFADNDSEIDSNRWIAAVVENNLVDRTLKQKCLKAVVTSVVTDGNGFNNYIFLCSDIKLEIDSKRLRSFFNDKNVWMRVIFPKIGLNAYDNEALRSFLEIACKKCPNDESLRNLIRAKMKWNSQEFTAAHILFKKVNGDAAWKDLIFEQYTNFYKDFCLNKTMRQKALSYIIGININDMKHLNIKSLFDMITKDKKMNQLKSKYFRDNFYWNDVEDGLYNDLNLDYTLGEIVYGNGREEATFQRWLNEEWAEKKCDTVQKVLDKLIFMPFRDDHFWFMKSQIEIKMNNLNQAVETLNNAKFKLEKKRRVNEQIHICLAELEEKHGNISNARQILEQEILKLHLQYYNSINGIFKLKLALIRFEFRANNHNKAQCLLKEGIKKDVCNGRLLAEEILMENRDKRKQKIDEAMKNSGDKKNNGQEYVMLAAAKYYVSFLQLDESRSRFNLIAKKYPQFGDAWIWFYKFEMTWGNKNLENKVKIRCILADPLYGDIWEKLVNDIDNYTLMTEELLEVAVKQINWNDFYK